jgi:hypothetical protein
LHAWIETKEEFKLEGNLFTEGWKVKRTRRKVGQAKQ